MRRYRAERRGELPAAAGSADVVPLDGSVVRAVTAELAVLPGSQVMLASAATALALAHVLDDPAATPQKAAVAGQLRAVMAEIRGAQVGQARSPLSIIRGGRAL